VEPVEDPPSAHAGSGGEVADGSAFDQYGGQRASQDRLRVLVLSLGKWFACAGLAAQWSAYPEGLHREREWLTLLGTALRRARHSGLTSPGTGLRPDWPSRPRRAGNPDKPPNTQVAARPRPDSPEELLYANQAQ
jgi:hypothetical protein